MMEEGSIMDDTEMLYTRLDYYLSAYGTERSLMSAAEVDGYFTSIACNKGSLELPAWIAAIWGSNEDQPHWRTQAEEEEFLNLTLLMYLNTMNNLGQGIVSLVYIETEFDDEAELLADEWCAGFMRGACLTGLTRSGNQAFLDEVLAPVRLFGTEEGWQKQKSMSSEEIVFWQELIEPSILRLAVANHPDIQLNQPTPTAHIIH
ncbi:YecA family protein [Marinomonas agarivorans]|nr:YecA family protein [Marinomonas agarivorans]